jgi:hypothetical protein
MAFPAATGVHIAVLIDETDDVGAVIEAFVVGILVDVELSVGFKVVLVDEIDDVGAIIEVFVIGILVGVELTVGFKVVLADEGLIDVLELA